MAKLQRQTGTTSQIASIFVSDTTSTTGAGKTGLTNSNFTCYYKRNKGSASVAVTLDASSGVTLGTYEPSSNANGAIKEIDSTNMPGLYEFQPPNNAFASGADEVTFMLTGSGIHIDPIEFELTAINNQSTGFGLVNASANVAQWNGTNVSSPATAGIPDVNVKNINNTAAATPGASGGILISGSNSGTTTLGALTITGATTHTGNVAMAAGLTITQSTSNGHGISVTGNGTGNGILATSGSGTTGDGIKAVSAATNGNGATLVHAGSGSDLNATTTPLTLAKTTNITGFNDIAASAIVSSGAITTSGGKVSEVALVDTLTTYTGNTVQTGDAYARLGAPAGASVSADVAAVKSDTGAIKTSTNTGIAPGSSGGLFIAGSNAATTVNITGNLSGSVGSVTSAVTVGGVNSTASNIKKNTALSGFMFLMTDSTNHAPKTGLTVTGTVAKDGGSFGSLTNSVSEIANGWYTINLAAADLNGNNVALRFSASSADDRDVSILTQP